MARNHTITSRERELLELYHETGVDLSEYPPIMTPKEAAPTLRMTREALSQNRVCGDPVIPYIKIGRRVRYLRADICKFLLANRHDGVA